MKNTISMRVPGQVLSFERWKISFLYNLQSVWTKFLIFPFPMITSRFGAFNNKIVLPPRFSETSYSSPYK